jgi:hypothetical protein
VLHATTAILTPLEQEVHLAGGGAPFGVLLPQGTRAVSPYERFGGAGAVLQSSAGYRNQKRDAFDMGFLPIG